MTDCTNAVTEEEHVPKSEVQEDEKSEFKSDVVTETQSTNIGEQHTIFSPALEGQNEESSCTATDKVLAMEEKDEAIETSCTADVKAEAYVVTSNEANEDTKVAEQENNPFKNINEKKSINIGEGNAILLPAFEEHDEESCTTTEYAIPDKDPREHFKLTEADEETESQIESRDEVEEDDEAGELKTKGIEIIDEMESTVSHEQQSILASSLEEQHEVKEDAKVSELEDIQAEALNNPESGSIDDQHMALSPDVREHEKESDATAEHTIEEELDEDFKMTDCTNTATEEEHVPKSEVQEDEKSEFKSNVVTETQGTSIGEQHTIFSPALEGQNEESSCTATEKVVAMEEKDEDIETSCTADVKAEAYVVTSNETNEDTKVAEKENNPFRIINEKKSINIGEGNAISLPAFEKRDEESCTTAEYAIPDKDPREHFNLTEADEETESQIESRDEVEEDDEAGELKTRGIEIIDEMESTVSHEQQSILASSLEEQHEVKEDAKVSELEDIQVEALNNPESRSIDDQALSPDLREHEKESDATAEHTIEEELDEDFKMNDCTNAATEEEHISKSEVQEDENSEFKSNVVTETQSTSIGEQHTIFSPALDEQHEESSCTATERVLAMEEKDEDIDTSFTTDVKTEAHVVTSYEPNEDTKVAEQESNPFKIINEQRSRSIGEQNAILPLPFEEQDEESCTTEEYAIPEKDPHEHFKLSEATDETESQIQTRDEVKQDAGDGELKTNGIEITDKMESTGSHEQQPILASSLEEQYEVKEDAKVSEIEDNQVEALNNPESRGVNDQHTTLSPALEEKDKESCTNTEHAIEEALHEDFKMTDHNNATIEECVPTSDEVQLDATGKVKSNVVDIITETQSTTIGEQHTILFPALEEQHERSCTTAETVLTMEEKDEDVDRNCTTDVKTQAHVVTTDDTKEETKVAEQESKPVQIINEPERRSDGEQDATLHPAFEEQYKQSCTTEEHVIAEKNPHVDIMLTDATDATELQIPTRDEVKEDAEAELQSNGVEIIDETESMGSHEQQRIMVPCLEKQHDKPCTVAERVISAEEQNENFKLVHTTQTTINADIATSNEVKEDAELESNQVEIIKEQECKSISEQLIDGTDATKLQIPNTYEVSEDAEVERYQVEIIKEKECRSIGKQLTDATEVQIPTTDEVKKDSDAVELQRNVVEIIDETESTGSREQQPILTPSLEEQHNGPSTISEKVITTEEQNENFQMTHTTETTKDAGIATSNEVKEAAEVEIIKKQESRSISEQLAIFSQDLAEKKDLCASTEYTIKEGDMHKDFNTSSIASDTIINVNVATGDSVRENTKAVVIESPQVQTTNYPECTSIAEYITQYQDLEKQQEEQATEEDNDFKINKSTGAAPIEPNIASTNDGVREDVKIEDGAIIHEVESGGKDEQQVNLPPTLKGKHVEPCEKLELAITEEEVHEEIMITLPLDANTEVHNSACDTETEDAIAMESQRNEVAIKKI